MQGSLALDHFSLAQLVLAGIDEVSGPLGPGLGGLALGECGWLGCAIVLILVHLNLVVNKFILILKSVMLSKRFDP